MHYKPGFRFSVTDACAIAVCALVTWLLRNQDSLITFAFAVGMAHFFLFCNVFRVRQKFELIWAFLFVCNVIVWVTLDRFNWTRVLATQTPLTALLIALEILSPQYHGIGWRLINEKNVKPWEENSSKPVEP